MVYSAVLLIIHLMLTRVLVTPDCRMTLVGIPIIITKVFAPVSIYTYEGAADLRLYTHQSNSGIAPRCQ